MERMNTIIVTAEQADKAERMVRYFSKNVWRKDRNETAEILFAADENTVKRIMREADFS